MTTPQNHYPMHWNLDAFFTSFQGSDYKNFLRDLDIQKVALLTHLQKSPELSATAIADWAKFMGAYEDFQARTNHLTAYVHMLSSVNTTDEAIAKENARIADWSSDLTQMGFALERALGTASETNFENLLANPSVSELKFFLTQKRTHAKERMDAELENLQVELGVNGELAWSQLYSQLCGKLTFDLELAGKPTLTHSFSKKNTLLGSADAAVRLATLRGSNLAIKTYEDVFASALNALAGTRHTLWKRRGQSGFLESAMQGSQVKETTIDAMYAAIKENLPRLRRHLKTKAKVLGKTKLGFQDLSAPIPPRGQVQIDNFDWDEGVQLVLNAFATYPRLQAYCQTAITSAWIDAAPGDHRAPGGYCTGSDLAREARIYMTYAGTFGDLQTLAHELGHAYHSFVLNEKRPLLGQYPMTLAETASTFAQTLLVKDVLKSPQTEPELRAQILNEMTNDITSFCLDIMMRYEFEKRFYTQRLQGTLSAKDLCALMTEVQKEVFGDALAEDELDPYFWASKMHFFFSGLSFYNFPYTFGYLLSRYLVKKRLDTGSDFDQTYEAFLLASGNGTCEDVCRKILGEDITQKNFWSEALVDCIKDLDLFETSLAPTN